MAEPSFNRIFVYDPREEEEITFRADIIYFEKVKPLLEPNERKPLENIPVFTLKSYPRIIKPRRRPPLPERRNCLYKDSIESRIDLHELEGNTEFKALALRDIMMYRSIKGFNDLDSAARTAPRAIGHVYERNCKLSKAYQRDHQ